MAEKIRVGVLFGGKSSEHEISLLSARSVVDALDKKKYEPVLIGIDKQGSWRIQEQLSFATDALTMSASTARGDLALVPSEKGDVLLDVESRSRAPVDVVFPVLHGKFGEDGCVQGLLEMMGVPFVGAGVLGSAVGMDKEITKRLLKEAGLPVGRFLVCKRSDRAGYCFAKVVEDLGCPFFVKPANAGSSVGVSKVSTEQQWHGAMEEAFLYDHKVLLEEYIAGREIECAVLGNDFPKASLPGEVIPEKEFYSYEAKYLDEKGARLEYPAKLTQEQIEEVQQLSRKVFSSLCCTGMARVDFFLTLEGKFVVNEINTIPGFTSISMYPKLWQISGLPYDQLLDELITLALEQASLSASLTTSYQPVLS